MTENKNAKVYLMAMGIFYLAFGLITIFYPKMMQLFQTASGVAANTPFSDTIWVHEGLDILSVTILLFVLSRQAASAAILRATAVVALMPAIGIVYSCFATPFWSMLFLGPCVFCVAFSVWGFALAGKAAK